jgi:hypothetical protein
MLDFGQREPAPMADETVERFLARREQELMSTAAMLRGQLAPVEAELAKVRRMRSVLNEPQNVLRSDNPTFGSLAALSIANSPLNALASNSTITSLIHEGYAGRTIKDLAIQTLLDAFENGATITQIKEFMKHGYGRTIDAGSLRTQLHRLKGAGILIQNPDGTWNFRDGQRALYARYDHPTSRAAMADLQDSPPADEPYAYDGELDDPTGILKAAADLAWRETTPTPEEIAAAERLEELKMHRYATSREAPSSTSNNEIKHEGGKLKLNPRSQRVGPQGASNTLWPVTAVDDR